MTQMEQLSILHFSQVITIASLINHIEKKHYFIVIMIDPGHDHSILTCGSLLIPSQHLNSIFGLLRKNY